jgi:hypothetical protein
VKLLRSIVVVLTTLQFGCCAVESSGTPSCVHPKNLAVSEIDLQIDQALKSEEYLNAKALVKSLAKEGAVEVEIDFISVNQGYLEGKFEGRASDRRSNLEKYLILFETPTHCGFVTNISRIPRSEWDTPGSLPAGKEVLAASILEADSSSIDFKKLMSGALRSEAVPLEAHDAWDSSSISVLQIRQNGSTQRALGANLPWAPTSHHSDIELDILDILKLWRQLFDEALPHP